MIRDDCNKALASPLGEKYRNKAQLILTSPPFPLYTKKSYGNLIGQNYIDWLSSFGEIFRNLLTSKGSLVIEVGNSWEKGHPVMSTTCLEALLALKKAGGFYLCQELIYHNTAKLPTPAQWVNVERIRLKDSFTRLWWLSKTPRPKANNRKVLQPYSDRMKEIVVGNEPNNSGRRPSAHKMLDGAFSKNNGGSIPGNVLSIGNTNSQDSYQSSCRKYGIKPHPARMPERLAEFFIEFLTTEGDLVVDPFAGSNTTGAVAERLRRAWLSMESNKVYAESSKYRFEGCRLTVCDE
jgi:site-specific DNA-methyltransferase (cytosine-N4-specific)